MLTRGGLINEKQLENGRNAQNTTQKYIKNNKSDDKWIKKLIKLLTKYKIKVNICLQTGKQK